jgi:hypothetical protein
MLADLLIPRKDNYQPSTPNLDINEIVFRFDLFA